MNGRLTSPGEARAGAMVRSGYPMVIRPAAVSFFLPQREEGAPESVKQLVRLRRPERMQSQGSAAEDR